MKWPSQTLVLSQTLKEIHTWESKNLANSDSTIADVLKGILKSGCNNEYPDAYCCNADVGGSGGGFDCETPAKIGA